MLCALRPSVTKGVRCGPWVAVLQPESGRVARERWRRRVKRSRFASADSAGAQWVVLFICDGKPVTSLVPVERDLAASPVRGTAGVVAAPLGCAGVPGLISELVDGGSGFWRPSPRKTALAVIDWLAGRAEVAQLQGGVRDGQILEVANGGEKLGIDCPLGWPMPFVEFISSHQNGHVVLPPGVQGLDWRRRLAFRTTDAAVRTTTEQTLIPLSVAAAGRVGLPRHAR